MYHGNDMHSAVLVVEDDDLARLDISLALSDAGFAVVETASAEEALEILEQRKSIGVVFSDIDLPGMDGLALREKIATRWPRIKVLMTSGRVDGAVAEIDQRAMFFAKPYDSHAVISSVRDVAA